jgi:ribose-phosphate pyrophosphokinase
MKPLLFTYPQNENFEQLLARALPAEIGKYDLHRFPDGESQVRLDSVVKGREVLLLCSLDRPDEKILPIYFLAATARDLGASRVGLVAPYLPYMRQDQRFKPGEGISAAYFARLISGWADFLVTVDPHLHRIHSLAEIYSIPSKVVHAAPLLSEWVKNHVKDPILIGPDQESEQWVQEVAVGAGAPFVVLKKLRRGDREVQISLPDMEVWRGRCPVLVDDIISTGHTMKEAAGKLLQHGFVKPRCLGVHGIFAGEAYQKLLQGGVAKVITCNTIAHSSNEIDVSVLLAGAVRELLIEKTVAKT